MNGSSFDRFVSRAYRDWSRTFHGVAKLEGGIKEDLACKASGCLHQSFQELQGRVVPKSDETLKQEFDHWHREACSRLRDHYAHGLEEIPTIRITYGQCQKWVNMLMKYGWVSGGADWGWCECWFRVAHAPVDQVILKAALAEKAVFQAPCKSWAKWDNYDEYLQFQEQIRTVAAKTATTPLELEFEWWEKYSKLSLVQSSRES